MQVEIVFLHAPDAEQRKQLHRLDDDILIAALSLDGGSSIEVVTRDEHRAALLGPSETRPTRSEAARVRGLPADLAAN